jgi:hypothetical protein
VHLQTVTATTGHCGGIRCAGSALRLLISQLGQLWNFSWQGSPGKANGRTRDHGISAAGTPGALRLPGRRDLRGCEIILASALESPVEIWTVSMPLSC